MQMEEENLFSLSHKTRTQAVKLGRSRFRADKRKSFLTQCVSNWWNSLPQDAEMTTGVDIFKGN